MPTQTRPSRDTFARLIALNYPPPMAATCVGYAALRSRRNAKRTGSPMAAPAAPPPKPSDLRELTEEEWVAEFGVPLKARAAGYAPT